MPERAAALVRLRRGFERHWAGLRFGDVRVHTDGGYHHFAAALYVDDLDPDTIAVELYAEASGSHAPARTPMRRRVPLIGARGFTYVAEVPDARPPANYTPRAVPAPSDAAVGPLELPFSPFIVWAS